MQQQPPGGTNWPHPLAPPLGRPPPPPPPTRPLAPPLSQHPPPPPPPRPPTFQPQPSFPPQFAAPPHTTSQQSASLPPPLPPPSTSHPPPPPPENAEPTPPEPSQKSESTATTESKDKTSPSTSGGFEKVKFKPTSGGGLLGKRSSGPTISMKIGVLKAAPEPKKPKPEAKKPALVSQVFGNDSDEEEEMPPEAKLRMRNIGKNTPTSSGPNSFYKGKMGFSDPRAGYKRYSEDD